MEVCSLRDELNDFKTLETTVYGVSVQNQESHKKFAGKHNLGFPLLKLPNQSRPGMQKFKS